MSRGGHLTTLSFLLPSLSISTTPSSCLCRAKCFSLTSHIFVSSHPSALALHLDGLQELKVAQGPTSSHHRHHHPISLLYVGSCHRSHILARPSSRVLALCHSRPLTENLLHIFTMSHHRTSSKKYLYLEPPIPGSMTVRKKITRIIPAAEPAPPPRPVIVAPPPPPPPAPIYLPPPPEPDPIDVIAVDVDAKSSKSSSSRSRSRHRHRRPSSSEREREVYIERERLVPVPVPVKIQQQPEYETYRYVDAPRRVSPPALPPPRREEVERERERIVVEDHRRRREYYGRS